MKPGVAHQRPASPIGLAEEIGNIRCAHKAFLLLARTDALSQVWDKVERLEEVAGNVGAEALELGAGPTHDDARQLLVRGESEKDAVRADVDFRSPQSHRTS